MKRRAIVVDDEPPARRRLMRMLAAMEGIEVVAEAEDLAGAEAAIEAHDPDVLLLDVELPDGDSFALFERVAIRGHVVFVTAYSRYAVRAFEINALDYVLKPVSAERLRNALERIPRGKGAVMAAPIDESDTLAVRDAHGLRFVRVADLVRIEASKDYSELHLASGHTMLSDTSMEAWVRKLPTVFVRVHRGHIVRLDQVMALESRRQKSGWQLCLDGAIVPVGRRYLKVVRQALTDYAKSTGPT